MIKASSGQEQYLVRASNGRFAVHADALHAHGRRSEGFRPHELLEAALATSLNMSIRKQAYRHGIPLRFATTRVELDRGRTGEVAFSYRIELHGELSEEQRSLLLAAAEECPVRQTLSKKLVFGELGASAENEPAPRDFACDPSGVHLAMRQFIRHPAGIPIEVSGEDRETTANRTVRRDSHNVSLGGLAFQSTQRIERGRIVELRIPSVRPRFETRARVVWCSAQQGGFELGVEFLDQEDAFRARMVEQVCHIESYKKAVLRDEGRRLTVEEAALEWIGKYADSFPPPAHGKDGQD